MKTYQKILAAVDFTEPAFDALAEAMRLARQHDAALLIVHVVESLVMSDLQQALQVSLDQLKSDVQQDMEKKLGGVADELEAETAGDGGTTTALKKECRIIFGHPTEEMLKTIDSEQPDLVVLARNSTSNPKRGAGTYAVKCVRKSPVPVMLVRGGFKGPYKSVAACVDFSDFSKLAVETAIDIAQRDGAKLNLVHAFYPPWEVVHFTAVPVDTSPQFQDEYRNLLIGRLDRMAESLADRMKGLDVNRHVVAAPTHAAGVVEFLEETGSDLAVLASHGRTGIRRFLLGSTAERVIRDAPCSVLTVKTPNPPEE